VRVIDLNSDMGESFGAYKLGMDEEVIKYITSANIACGWHAGDPIVMDKTVKMAVEHGVGVGAHPGYPDLLGFGRRNMNCNMEDIKNYLIYQIGALEAFCKVHGTRLRHVKPHGALYLTAVENKEVARAVAEAIVSVNPDLFYVALPGAVIKDPEVVSKRALKMAKEGKVIAVDGTIIPMEVQTLCVHGDTPTAVDLVKSIRAILEDDGVEVKPMIEFA